MSLSLRRNLFILSCSLSLEAPGDLRFEVGVAGRVMDALLTRSSAGFIHRF
jgi:hypothetical protein